MGIFDAFKDVIQYDVPLAGLTWLRTGGPVAALATPNSEEELLKLLDVCAAEQTEPRVIGEGSAILAPDAGCDGLAVRLSAPAFAEIRLEPPYAFAGAGARLGRLATACAEAGLGGIEGLIGVPGTVGAAALLNASTPDVSLGQWVESVRIATLDGKVHELGADELVFGYRSSSLENVVVLSVVLRLEEDDPQTLGRRLQKIWIARKKKTPDLKPTEGVARMFRNPRGQNAAEIIDAAGFRGAKFGSVAVSETDPNLAVASQGCSSEEIARLLKLIQSQTLEKLGIELEPELEIWSRE